MGKKTHHANWQILSGPPIEKTRLFNSPLTKTLTSATARAPLSSGVFQLAPLRERFRRQAEPIYNVENFLDEIFDNISSIGIVKGGAVRWKSGFFIAGRLLAHQNPGPLPASLGSP